MELSEAQMRERSLRRFGRSRRSQEGFVCGGATGMLRNVFLMSQFMTKDCVQDVLESICLEGERDGVCGGNCRLVLVLVLTAMIPEGRLNDMERLVSAGYPRSVLQLPRLGARWPKKGSGAMLKWRRRVP
jgi:hypothetical protein